ncbi:MAG TPA: carbohydrate ABC transporter permease [Ktedonobacterales bacterium]|nr:carbohydrate ABC transporter permease [Ktedonobacterales bacterium]
MSTTQTTSGADSSAELALKPSGAAVAAGQRRTLAGQLVHALSSSTLTVIVVLIALLWSVPTIGLFVSSFRPHAAINSTGWWTSFFPPWQFTIENYQNVIQSQGLGQAFINSLIIAIPGTILPVLVGAFAAYAFAWMKFPLRDWIFLIIVALLIVPVQTILIPVQNLFADVYTSTGFGITGSYIAVWLVHTALGLPFAIYLLRSFFGALPSDLFESASIDGASHLRVFFSILLPLSVPSLASLVIFQFMWVWNDLLVALIFLGGNPDRAPLTVNIANLVNGSTSAPNYEVLTSAAFLSMALPLVIFFALQRYFVRGILAGSVKG